MDNNLNEILYSIGKLEYTEETDIEKQLEFIILYNKTIKKLNYVSDIYNESIKEYYSNHNLNKKEINSLIIADEKINLNFMWNKSQNFSCKLVSLSNQEEHFIVSTNSLSFFSQLNNLSITHKGIKITDFRCRENRESYIKIINMINILSQLKFNNITLK